MGADSFFCVLVNSVILKQSLETEKHLGAVPWLIDWSIDWLQQCAVLGDTQLLNVNNPSCVTHRVTLQLLVKLQPSLPSVQTAFACLGWLFSFNNLNFRWYCSSCGVLNKINLFLFLLGCGLVLVKDRDVSRGRIWGLCCACHSYCWLCWQLIHTRVCHEMFVTLEINWWPCCSALSCKKFTIWEDKFRPLRLVALSLSTV